MTQFARQAGFTLIEMVIAMTLLSIMMVMLFSSLKVASQSWNAGENKVMAANKKAVVYQFFRQHLISMRPLMTQISQESIMNGELPQPVFLGQSQTIRFVGTLPMSSARRGLQVFQIAANPDDTSKLMVALSPYQISSAQYLDKEVLVDHVKSFIFAYFGQPDPNAPPVWTNDWPVTDQLPKLIKVSILLDDNSYWPDMIFPIRINGLVLNNQNQLSTGRAD